MKDQEGGHAQAQRTLRTRHEYPGVIIAAHETLPGESWSRQRNAREHLLHHCGHFRTLRRVVVMVAGALDEGRIGGFERQHAMLCQIWDTRVWSGGQSMATIWCGLAAARIVRPRRPTRRPLVT